MITVGLIKELLFLSEAVKAPVSSSISYYPAKGSIIIGISGGVMTLLYEGELIWREDVGGDTSMFGIESCHTIAQIVILIDKKDPRWKELRYLENAP